ncbi:MAG: anti-sigma factor family protein, partial [Longimicrobiales bacterium]
MSHVDEGLLHAYLDGAFPLGHAQGEEIEAHLAVCVDCRALLEEARALKDRSQMVLRHAAPPDVRIPPFEELRARRGGALAPGSSTKRGWFPPPRLAWAASLVLALGAGWMANDLARSSAPVASEAYQLQTFTAEQDASPRSPASDVSSAGAAAPDREQVPAPPPTPTSVQDRAEPEALLRENVAGAAGGRSRLAAPPAGQRSTGQAEEKAEAAAARALDSVAARRLLLEESRDVTSNALRMQAAGRAAEAPPPASSPPPILSLNEVVIQPLEARKVALGAASSDAIVLLLNDYIAVSTAATWQQETPATAGGRVGRDLASLDGLDAHAIEVARVKTRDLVRSLYRIDGGTTVELVQRAAPALNDSRVRQDASDALSTA